MPETMAMAGSNKSELCEAEPCEPGSVMAEVNGLCSASNHYENLVDRAGRMLEPLLSPPYPAGDQNKTTAPEPACNLSAQIRDIKNHIAYLNESLEMLLNRVAL